MSQLQELTGETVSLFARSEFQRVCIEQVEGSQEYHWAEFGRVFPLYVGASGKLILAYMDDVDLKRYFDSITLDPLTAYTIVDPSELKAELQQIRAQGWAISCQDRVLGAGGAAAPVFNRFGDFEAALTIAAPMWRATDVQFRKWIPPLIHAADNISRLLGMDEHRRAAIT
jgi:DNA-binding IclR family transcriptional regulator